MQGAVVSPDPGLQISLFHVFRSCRVTVSSGNNSGQTLQPGTGSAPPNLSKSLGKTSNSMASLLALPNELLCRIISFLKPTVVIHSEEGAGVLLGNDEIAISGLSKPVLMHLAALSDLRSLALVCKRFVHIVEDSMYKSVSLPQHRYGTFTGHYLASRVPFFLRTILRRPELAAKVETLRLWVRRNSLGHDPRFHAAGIQKLSTPPCACINPYEDCIAEARAVVLKQPQFPSMFRVDPKLSYICELQLGALILASLPNLNTLHLSGLPSMGGAFSSYPGFPMYPKLNELATALQGSRLEYLELYSGDGLVQFQIPNLKTVAGSVWTLRPGQFGTHMENCTDLHVRSCSRDIYTVPQPLRNLQLLLRKLPSIRSLVFEPEPGTIPLSGPIRTRLGYDIDHTQEIRADIPDDLEQPQSRLNFYPPAMLFHIPEPTGSFTEFLTTLELVEDRLEELQLPDNWFSSTGKIARPIQSLKNLRVLRSLAVPKIAVISFHYQCGDERDTTSTPGSLLPDSLEQLRIYQADLATCEWVEEAFWARKELRRMRDVALCFRDDFLVAPIPEGFKREARIAGVKLTIRWQGKAVEVIE
ncbi:hypothetical protein BCR34DRAFT_240366 [Clohesyomyces aquaticus]|uniref:Uncharacterized protein n=1 Tax=Clohesyomyces aquaticus TaxID=1231657 RepID=A0A1Y1Y6T0_9PLEO|nr:hypothetical protein BCR34DRAFT_240366 [Clohesyomyces aquaticus]